MKNILLYSLAALSVLVLSVSCSDFLDEEPRSSLSDAVLFKTASDVDAALVGVYESLAGSVNGVTGNGGWAELIPSRGVGIVGTDMWSFAKEKSAHTYFSRYLITPGDNDIKAMWASLYEMIGRANNVIAKIAHFESSNPELYKSAVAESKFLRAFAYYDLVQYFGSVPIRLSASTTIEQASSCAKSTEEQVWEQIFADLIYASEHLPSTPKKNGRADKWAAKTLLAKSYMARGGYPLGKYQEKIWFEKALALTDDIITNSGKSLMATGTDRSNAFNNYGKIFLSSGEHCSESIFEIEFEESVRGGAWGFRGVKASQKYYDPFGDYWNYWGGNAVGMEFALSFADDDIRFQWSIAPFFIADNDNDGVSSRYGGPADWWYNYKFRLESRPGNNFGNSVNARVFRLADVYLMHAECYNEAFGAPDAASAYALNGYHAINAVRSRALISEMDNAYLMADSPFANKNLLYGMSLNSFNISDPNYSGRHVYYAGATSKERFRDAILIERGWELCFERHRWFDLKRMGRLVDITKNTKVLGNGVLTDEAVKDPINKSLFKAGSLPTIKNEQWVSATIEEHNTYMPIPNVELQLNGALSAADQNPGY